MEPASVRLTAFRTPITEPMHEIPCAACGGTEYQRLQIQNDIGFHSLLECNQCSLVRMERLPSPPTEPTATETTPVLESFNPFLEWLKTQLILKPEIRRLKPCLKGKGPVLDVGCGTGRATALWRDHGAVEVHGMEFEPLWADMASQRFGLHTIKGRFEDTDIPDESYELIIFRHVLEHFADPAKVLAQALRILRPGGHVLIIVPNGDGLGRRIFRRYWAWGVSDHIYTFSPISLGTLLKRVGFKDNRVLHSPSPMLLAASLHNWLVVHGMGRTAKWLHPGSLISNALFFPLSLGGKIFGRGEVITVLAQKCTE